MVTVRYEKSESREEIRVIRSINEAAFHGQEEADLVARLRTCGNLFISLVAEIHERIVGHIVFSRMWIESSGSLIPAVALAPVAVLPEYQHQGIGGKLIRHGLELLSGQGEKIVIVVGHADYYPRFGFSSANARSIESPFPSDAFMAMELSPGALDGVRGKVKYPAAFGI